MAVEGIQAVREGHLLRQLSIAQPIADSGADCIGEGDWNDSLWSLSCTESDDPLSETYATTSRLLSSDTLLPLQEQSDVTRSQSSYTRRQMQRTMTLTVPRSPSISPKATKSVIGSGVPIAIGLDCFELRRRSRNWETAKRTSRVARAATITASPTAINGSGGDNCCRERAVLRRIQSLNRYATSNRESCDLGLESLSTKPPRPPNSNRSITVSPPRSRKLESEVSTGWVAGIVNRIEGLIPSQHQTAHKILQGSRSFDQSELSSAREGMDEFTTEQMKSKSPSSDVKQKPESASLLCRARCQHACFSSLPENHTKSAHARALPMRTAFLPQGCNLQDPENTLHFEQSSSNSKKILNPIEALPLRVPVVPVEMTTSALSTPPRPKDEVSLKSLDRKLTKCARFPPSTTISLCELIQFCHLSCIYVPPQAPSDCLRRSSWEAGELIPGLGIRVSVTQFPPYARLPSTSSDNAEPRSVFIPGSVPNRSDPLAPLVIVIDEVPAARSVFFLPGQIILEVNGVNFFSTAAKSKHGLLMHLIEAVFAAYGSGDGGLHIALATPQQWRARRSDHQTIKARFHEQH